MTKSQPSKQNRKRKPKGSVSVRCRSGNLCLVWQCPITKKRRYFYTGFPDSKTNRAIAQQQASLIELEIKTGTYTGDILHLTPEYDRQQSPTFVDVLREFCKLKANSVSKTTLAKYKNCLNQFYDYFEVKEAKQIREADVWRMVNSLKSEGIGNTQIKRKLGVYSAAWEWSEVLSNPNPWAIVMGQIRPETRQPPKPFTLDEIAKIINVFQSVEGFQRHLFMVRLSFSYGIRPGEIMGIQKSCLSNDFTELWIGQILSRGKLKPPKANKTRTLFLEPEHSEMLKAISQKTAQGSFIFTTETGKPIDDHNFLNRVWTPALQLAKVEHRPFKNCRHTFVSHALDQGLTPWEIMGITGHTEKVMFSNYAAQIRKTQKIKRVKLFD